MLLFALWAFAAASPARAAEACNQSRAALLACIDQSSPELQGARLAVDRFRAQEGAAGQWINPSLGVNSIGGSVGGVRNRETDFNLSVPIELGGKVFARRGVARGQTAGGEAALYGARVKLRVASLLYLNRYRQALHEKEVTEEAVSSFARLIGQYSRRARLSPEQETSVAVYRMAKNEYQLRSTALSNELAELATFFRTNAGISESELAKLLPPSPETWPNLEGAGDFTKGPRIQALAADLQTAEAELAAARSLAWPTLAVGPSARLQTQGATSGTLWGFNVGVPLPLFNVNGAGQAAAAANVQLGQTVRDLGLTVERNERARAEQVYRQSVELVKASASHAELEATHRKIDQTFKGGLVPSALIIEAHRTYVELEKSRHERELNALRALFDIYSIDGTLLEKAL